MKRLLIVMVFCAPAFVSAPATAQSGGLFEITRSTLDAGGSTERSPDNVVVRGTVGQPDVGAMGFGIVYLTGGFWATQGRLGIFFLDGFESGDTTAWMTSVGEVVRTPEADPAASTTPVDATPVTGRSETQSETQSSGEPSS